MLAFFALFLIALVLASGFGALPTTIKRPGSIIGTGQIASDGSGNAPHLGDSTIRFNVQLDSQLRGRSRLKQFMLVFTTKSGDTAPATIDIEILRTNDLGAALDSIFTIYKKEALAVNGSGAPDTIIDATDINRVFDQDLTQTDDASQIQIVIVPNGASANFVGEFTTETYFEAVS